MVAFMITLTVLDNFFSRKYISAEIQYSKGLYHFMTMPETCCTYPQKIIMARFWEIWVQVTKRGSALT